MAGRLAGPRLTGVLYLVAAALAWAAVGIRYYRSAEVAWVWAAAGLFCLVMGLSAWKRARAPEIPPRDRGPTA